MSLLVHWDDTDNNFEPPIFSFQLNQKPWCEKGKDKRSTYYRQGT